MQNLKPEASSMRYVARAVREPEKGGFQTRPYIGMVLTILIVLCGVGADAAVAFVADFAEGLRIGVGEAGEHTVESFAYGFYGGRGVVVGPA